MRRVASVTIAAFIISMSGSAFAAPGLQIHSPQNTTYNIDAPILLNVTSNETVNFYVRTRYGKPAVVKSGSNSYTSNIFGTRGHHKLLVYVNNSNGLSSAGINYSINHSSTVNVTDCGILATPNTTYVVQNNLSGGVCIIFTEPDIILDLNKFTITGDIPVSADCQHSEVRNGKVVAAQVGLEMQGGSKCQIKNVEVDSTFQGVLLQFFSYSLIENVTIRNAQEGINLGESTTSVILRNITMTTSNADSKAFVFEAFDSSVMIENSSATNFTKAFLFSNVNNADVYMRNNAINLSSVHEDTAISSAVRVYDQHLMTVKVTDLVGLGKAASVEMVDNGVLPRTNAEENTYTFLSNPTGRVIVGTDSNGSVSTYITERLIVYRTESPLTSQEFDFGFYNVTARSGSVDQTLNINTNVSSVININFTIAANETNTSLPVCTISQMLDLNNDGTVNSHDAKFILRWMVGHNVSVSSTKGCNALNFVPL